jgi:hypothetical protein
LELKGTATLAAPFLWIRAPVEAVLTRGAEATVEIGFGFEDHEQDRVMWPVDLIASMIIAGFVTCLIAAWLG